MARYIDAEKLWQELDRHRFMVLCSDYDNECSDYLRAVEYALRKIEDAPTADVVEVRHGYWKPSRNGINPIRCSECNMPAPKASGENEFGDFVIERYPSSYCHECGAKMDGGKNENV